MPTTTELLPTLNADVLKALARQLGLAKTITRKPELIAELDGYVREHLPNLLAHCSETEKQLLAEAAHNRGPINPTAFRAKYGVACPLPENPRWGSTKNLLLLLLDYQDGEDAALDSGPASMEVSQFAAGIEAFLWDDDFDELNRVNHIRGQSGGGKRYLTPPTDRRPEIAESVAQWPVNQWITFDEAVRYLLATGHQFAVTDADHTLYFGELQYGMLGGQGGQINRQYLRAFLFECLATLGLIDVAYVYPHHLWPELGDSWGIDELSFCSRYDGLLYMRLNALGAYCLDATDAYQPAVPSEPRRGRVLPNREIALVDGQQLSPADRH
jgi:hypothetical protein